MWWLRDLTTIRSLYLLVYISITALHVNKYLRSSSSNPSSERTGPTLLICHSHILLAQPGRRHDKETYSASLALVYMGTHRSPLHFSREMSAIRSFDVFYLVNLNKLLNIHPCCWSFETPWHSCYITEMIWLIQILNLCIGIAVFSRVNITVGGSILSQRRIEVSS